MKVIFLDFDGVLNDEKWVAQGRDESCDVHSAQWDASGLDPSKVRILNDIVSKTGAKIVISSSWRMGRTIGQIREILEIVGFVGEIIGRTKSSRCQGDDRGDQIAHWLQVEKAMFGDCVETFAILDDDNDMGPVMPMLVKTSFREGLTEEKAEQVVRLLLSDSLIIGV
jgi:hypothetical protein